MNYKHIIFDFGNVLATFQSDDLLRSYCNSEDLPILKDAIYHNWQALDEGSISYENTRRKHFTCCRTAFMTLPANALPPGINT